MNANTDSAETSNLISSIPEGSLEQRIAELEAQIKQLNNALKKSNRAIERLRRDKTYMASINDQVVRMRDLYEQENKRQIMYNEIILSNAPDMFCVLDENQRLLMATELFFQFFGISKEKLWDGLYLSDIVYAYINQDAADKVINALLPGGRHEAAQQFEIVKDGQLYDIDANIRSVRNDDGTFSGYVVTLRDVTELVQAKARAERADRAKSDFLANMSHEIRTPIHAVLGLNEMVIRETKEPATQEYAQNIQRAGQSLLAIINDVLDISKIESGKMEIVEAPYEFSSLLNDMVNMISIKAKQKGLKFTIDVDPGIPNELQGDETRLRQIMVNILNNAVKYTRAGNVAATITGERQDDQTILLKIAVADTGIGIRPEDQGKLFRNFERLNLAENRTIEGTGLGLAITAGLVEKMRGRITVESEYGTGSTFTVYLPQVYLKDEGIGDFTERYRLFLQHKQTYQESFTAPGAKILVVDDNEMNLLVAERLLRNTQVQITLCRSGRECLDKIAQEHYDVVLLDHMMPEMDGVETLQRALTLPESKCKGTPFIALTANAVAGVREKYLAIGFQDYMSKPVDPQKLEKLLQHYIPLQKVRPRDEESFAAQVAVKPERGNCLDPKTGLEFSAGMEDMYREFLEIFCEMMPEKQAALQTSIDKQDWESYTVTVHALKSNALNIGGKPLSELAYNLEQAGKKIRNGEERQARIDWILLNHPRCMILYEETVQEALAYLNS